MGSDIREPVVKVSRPKPAHRGRRRARDGSLAKRSLHGLGLRHVRLLLQPCAPATLKCMRIADQDFMSRGNAIHISQDFAQGVLPKGTHQWVAVYFAFFLQTGGLSGVEPTPSKPHACALLALSGAIRKTQPKEVILGLVSPPTWDQTSPWDLSKWFQKALAFLLGEEWGR